MWATLALSTALATMAPAQESAGALKLTNVRTTYSVLGPERKDGKVPKLLPGDMLVVSFDIDGLKTNDEGRVRYALGLKMTRKGSDKPEYKSDPQPVEAMNSLGGSSLPAFARTFIGVDVKPGEYTLEVTVQDREAKTSKVLTQKFEVIKPDFGFVRVGLGTLGGEEAPSVAVAGQRLFLHSSLVGFSLGKDKLPNVTFEMQVLEGDKPTVKKPFKGTIRTEIKEAGGLMMRFLPIDLQLNRPGKFKVVLKAKDNISGKTAEMSLPLTVLEK